MSEKLTRFHQELRAVKNELGIDLLDPMGVVIDGKRYPAMQKRVVFATAPYNYDYQRFHIPFENMHKANIFMGRMPRGKSNKGPKLNRISVFTEYPTNVGLYDLHSGKGPGGVFDSAHEEGQKIHDLLNEIGSEQSSGLRLNLKKPMSENNPIKVTGEDLRKLMKEHHATRKQMEIPNDRGPRDIEVLFGSKIHKYNILTEQLTEE